MRKVAAVFGTRPEQIKLEPVVEALRGQGVEVEWWWSGQSPDLVNGDANALVDWWRDERLSLLDGFCGTAMSIGMDADRFDALLVQGDTATAFAGAVAGFLAEVPVGHVEAGLRTYRREPWPEESFRQAIASFAEWHFCPDEESAENVAREIQEPIHAGSGFPGPIFVTGNPVIDTLPSQPFRVLVTLHRRENWGERIREALHVLSDFQDEYAHTATIEVVRHPNWDNQGIDVHWDGPNLIYRHPMNHNEFLEKMTEADLVVTDSGGLQEEAAYLGTDCVVYRSATERTALEDAGSVQVVDPSEPDSLRSALQQAHRKRFCYGDGSAGEQIAQILTKELENADAE